MDIYKFFKLLGVGLVSLYFWNYAETLSRWHFIDNVNLIFHEAGHTIFFFLGMYVQALMGSGLQVLLPLCISLYFFYNEQKISGALCLFWVGQNILNVSLYAGDAVAMQLPLLGGDAVMHDWHYLLSTIGLLNYTPIIAGTFYTIGILVLITASLLSVYYTLFENREK